MARHWGRVGRYALLMVTEVVVGFPIYITVVNSLHTPQQIAHRPPTLFPLHPQWGAFVQAFTTGHLGLYLRNSAVVTVAITVAALVTSVLAAYAFTFVAFPFRRALFFVCLATLMVPMHLCGVSPRRLLFLRLRGHVDGPHGANLDPHPADDRRLRLVQHVPRPD